MRQIIDSETRRVPVRQEDGSSVDQEQVFRVTFVDHAGSLHELVFHPAGTDVSGDAESAPRIVGEHKYDDGSTMQHYSFATPEDAVDAYENGKIA